MKKILYIGNELAVHGKPPTAIDTVPAKLREEGNSVETASAKKNKFARLSEMAFSIFKNRKKIDLVLIDTYSSQNFYYAVITGALCRFFKLPYIPVLHGGNLPQRLKNSKSKCRKLFKGAYTNVAPSEYLLEKFKAEGYSNLTYISNTIEIKNYPFKKREKFQPKLLWVRSFSKIYNPKLALKIVEDLIGIGYTNTKLCMVGPEKDGSLAQCKKIAEEKNLPVTFTGKLEKAEWIELSKNYDIFINTTNVDNTPVSVIEAMALGLPIISTNVGGLPYLIEHNIDGMLVNPDTVMEFVEVIQQFIENPAFANTLTQCARSKVEKFDWDVVKEQWLKILED